MTMSSGQRDARVIDDVINHAANQTQAATESSGPSERLCSNFKHVSSCFV